MQDIGKVRVRVPSSIKAGEVVRVRTLVIHPMERIERDAKGQIIQKKYNYINKVLVSYLGKQVAALLDTETPTQAIQEPHLQSIAAFKFVEKVPLEESKHFAVTAGWGHAGKGGVTMPGAGKTVERDYTAEEQRALGDAVKLLGDRTLDVHLNDGAYWANVPARVWDYTIGGYQVMKKWLSYREQKLLGRPLTKDEVRYVQEMARRIAAILLLEPELDANYLRVKRQAYSW